MNLYTKFELLKYAKHFITKEKPNVAKVFLNQIRNKATNKRELIMLNEMIECLEKDNSIYQVLVIERIDEILKNKKKKNYPIFSSMDNSTQMILS